MKFTPFSLNIGGSIRSYHRPAVMGIINITTDSFYEPSRHLDVADAAITAEQMVAAGADMLDVGACSTRPGSESVTPEVETDRLCRAVESIRERVGTDIPVSVDTFRAAVAAEAIYAGADIVNDIAGGTLDPDMFDTVARLRCPYILTHMRGTPATMQTLTDYTDVVADLAEWLCRRSATLHAMGVADVVVDPGFGFAKTLEQNYRLLGSLDAIRQIVGLPVLAGISNKSMLSKLPEVSAASLRAANAAATAVALERGASIVRVHSVDDAVAVRAVISQL